MFLCKVVKNRNFISLIILLQKHRQQSIRNYFCLELLVERIIFDRVIH